MAPGESSATRKKDFLRSMSSWSRAPGYRAYQYHVVLPNQNAGKPLAALSSPANAAHHPSMPILRNGGTRSVPSTRLITVKQHG
jgi:hypothetical protein